MKFYFSQPIGTHWMSWKKNLTIPNLNLKMLFMKLKLCNLCMNKEKNLLILLKSNALKKRKIFKNLKMNVI
jgi:hypothetical protein